MGPADALPLAEEVGHRDRSARGTAGRETVGGFCRGELIVLFFASIIFVTSIVTPPRLMDDVDAVQAQIARNMLQSGDWVTARLDGIAYLEKAPLTYWLIAVSFLT